MNDLGLEFQSRSVDNWLGLAPDFIGIGDKWKDSLTHRLIELHNGVGRKDENGQFLPDTSCPPKIIFVTATRAIPYAQAIKQCWKEAYTNEQQPLFIIIDVSPKRFGTMTGVATILPANDIQQIDLKEVERLKIIGSQSKGFNNCAVFDEWVNEGKTIRTASRILKEAGFNDINFALSGQWGHPIPSNMPSEELVLTRHPDETFPYRSLVRQNNSSVRNLMQDMKKIGHLMSEQIKIRNYQP